MCLAWGCEASGIDGLVSSGRQVGVGGHEREFLVVKIRTRVRADRPVAELTQGSCRGEVDQGVADLAGPRETDVREEFVHVVAFRTNV